MRTEEWLKLNTSSLVGKTVAISGSTGGLGQELCFYLASLGASLILLDRSREKSEALISKLQEKHEGLSVMRIQLDLADSVSVRSATEQLSALPLDIFICNAGAYSIPRYICDNGYDNVFQINFVSPYAMIQGLLPTLRRRHGRVVIVGSVAHRYSVSDPNDIDFSTRTKASLVYGNSKRYLMFVLAELFKNEPDVGFAITHPGISFTGITNHYPPAIFAIIKHPMKVIFPKPRRACLSVLRGVFEDTYGAQWIGPSIFDVWGLPKKRKLRSVSTEELEYFAKWNERPENTERKPLC